MEVEAGTMSLFSEQGMTRGERIQGSLSFRMGLGCCRSKTRCRNRVIDSVNTLGPQAGHRKSVGSWDFP